jgi:hypothetical protein
MIKINSPCELIRLTVGFKNDIISLAKKIQLQAWNIIMAIKKLGPVSYGQYDEMSRIWNPPDVIQWLCMNSTIVGELREKSSVWMRTWGGCSSTV